VFHCRISNIQLEQQNQHAYEMKRGKFSTAFPRLLYLCFDYLLAFWCPITDSNDYMPDSRITAGTGTRDAVPRDQHGWGRENNGNPNRTIRKWVGYIEKGGTEMWE